MTKFVNVFYFCNMKQRIVILLLFVALGLGSTSAISQNTQYWDGIESFDGPTDQNIILAFQLDFYFAKMVSPLPDSINMEISKLVKRTENNTDLRDFILWRLLKKYQHPEYMGQDQVFVYLYDNYFSKLDIKDLNDENRALIRDKAERLRRLALFQPAPEIKINDFDVLSSSKSKYTALFFYDHECDLCQLELHDLDSVCGTLSDITAIKIDVHGNPDGIEEIYEAYDIETTPLLYILDRDKRIIAKKIRAKQIDLVVK